MKNKIKRSLRTYFLFLYRAVFKEDASFEVKDFFKNLGYISVGYFFAAVATLVFQVLAGRRLGLAEYGKYALVNSVAMFLYFPMLLGIHTALIKYNAPETSPKRQKRNISTAFLLIFICSLLWIILALALKSLFLKIFGVSAIIFYLALGFALLYSLDNLVRSSLRSLHKIKTIAALYSFYGPLILLSLIVFILIKFVSFQTAIFSVYIGYFLIIVASLVILRKYLSFEFDNEIAKKFIKYGSLALIGGISSTFLVHINKILINYYLSIDAVGIYNAYYTSSINIVYSASTMVMIIFFPTVSRFAQKEPIFKKINKVLPFFYLLGTFLFFGLSLAVLTFYGQKYPINYSLILLFAFVGILIAHYSLYGWTFASEGLGGLKLTTITSAITATLTIGLGFILIPNIGLFGAIISLGLAYLIGVLILFGLKNRLK